MQWFGERVSLDLEVSRVQGHVVMDLAGSNIPLRNAGAPVSEFLGEMKIVVRRQSQAVDLIEIAESLFNAVASFLLAAVL